MPDREELPAGPTNAAAEVWYELQRRIQQHLPVPGVDTPAAKPQTHEVRSTDELEDEPVCEHVHVEKDDDGEFARRFFCLDCQQQVVPGEPDEDGESFWEEVN